MSLLTLMFIGSLFIQTFLDLCEVNQQSHVAECAQYHIGPWIIFWIVEAVDAHNGFVTALGTIAVAAFTWTLWRTSDKQAALTRESIDEARRSSERELRAYVEIDQAQFESPDSSTRPWWISIAIKNYGQTPAVPTQIKLEKFIGARRDRSVPFPFTEAALDSPPSPLPPGHHFTVSLYCPELGKGMAIWKAKNDSSDWAYVWGRIEYLDAFERKRYLTFQMENAFGDAASFGWCKGGNESGAFD